MKWLAPTAICCACWMLVPAEQPIAKTWSFTLPNGTLQIEVHVEGQVVGMGIGPGAGLPEAPIVEQVQPLKQVLAQMSSMGIDPRKVSHIGMVTVGEDVRRALAYECADSPTCHPSLPVTSDMVQALVSLLNRSRVFEPYNEAFNTFGLEVSVYTAEKVRLVPLSAVPARSARDRANGKVTVFGGAALRLTVTAIHPR
jgi:hypothetical protein